MRRRTEPLWISRLELRRWSTQFELVTVWIGKIDRRGWHPGVEHRSSYRHPMLPERCCSALNVVGIDREGQMLRGPVSLVFLQHQHTGLAAGAQEEPRPAFIPQANFQTKHIPIKGFCL